MAYMSSINITSETQHIGKIFWSIYKLTIDIIQL